MSTKTASYMKSFLPYHLANRTIILIYYNIPNIDCHTIVYDLIRYYFTTGVPSREPHPWVHGSATVTSDVQKARRRRRPQKWAERFEFKTGEHTTQTSAGDRTADMIRRPTGVRSTTAEKRLLIGQVKHIITYINSVHFVFPASVSTFRLINHRC